MNINENLTRIKNAKASIKASIEAKGVQVGEGTIDTYASKIDEIQTGGGEPILYLKDFPDMRLGGYMGATLPDNIILDGITNANRLFAEADGLVEVKGWDNSKCTNMYQMTSWADKLAKLGRIDVSNVSNMGSAFEANNLVEIHLAGGIKNGATIPNPFPNGGSRNGIVFYELPGDYSKMLNNMNRNWKAQPLGDVPLKIRVLKDAAWLSGDVNLTLNGNKLTYAGKGLYEISENLTKDNYSTKSTELQLDGVKIGDVKWQLNEDVIMTGDNSAIYTIYNPTQILEIATQNDGWTYDETVGGVRSRDIADGQKTDITLPIQGEFKLIFGQKSEANYDYAKAYNSAGGLVYDFKGLRNEPTESKEATIITDKSVRFEYHKDGSGTQEPDMFWIKEISSISYPPYPEV